VEGFAGREVVDALDTKDGFERRELVIASSWISNEICEDIAGLSN
jgi:hypothetical protein